MSRRKPAMVRLYINPEALTAVKRLAAKRGMSQTAVLTRLIAWFSSQPWDMQSIILGQISREGGEKLVDLITEQLRKTIKESGGESAGESGDKSE